MRTQKKKPERVIKGEVQSYGKDITAFPGGRGSRGLKIDEEWHNIIGYKDYLERLHDNHAPGSFVIFTERQNSKGYWDVIEGTLKKISKDEAYGQEKIPEISDSIIVGRNLSNPQEAYSVEDVYDPDEEKEKPEDKISRLLIFVENNQPQIQLHIPKMPELQVVQHLLFLIVELKFAENLLLKKLSNFRKSMVMERKE